MIKKEWEVKTITKQSERTAAFTIIELLTVMSVIVILISILVPSLNRARQFAKEVKQKAQFHSISVALETFRAQFDGYPDSDEMDNNNPQAYYCGAMKLAEAMMGKDMLGFHPDSRFWSNSGILYTPVTLRDRKGLYLQLDNANGNSLESVYVPFAMAPSGYLGPFYDPNALVLCDVFARTTSSKTGKRIGMPVLYYKANPSKTKHNVNAPDDPDNIYDYKDNDELVKLGMPWEGSGVAHRMASGGGITLEGTTPDPALFYRNTLNKSIGLPGGRPYRADSYILLSAGMDGEYGTRDDIFNFRN